MNMAWILTALTTMAPQADLPAGTPPARLQASLIEPAEVWEMTLPEAIRIGLDNSEVIRVVAIGAQYAPGNGSPIVISRLNADAEAWNFKAAVMAQIRSIEQQYWDLSQQQVAVWSRETAVKLGEEILRTEQAHLKAGMSNPASVAEAQQGLENSKLAYISAVSDVITTERQLRKILGLPPADNRRVVPVTAPTEAKVEPDYRSCLAEMMEKQPDIARQKLLVRLQELQLLVARNQLLPVFDLNTLYQFEGLGSLLNLPDARWIGQAIGPMISLREANLDAMLHAPAAPDPERFQVGTIMIQPGRGGRGLTNTRQALYQLRRQHAFLDQIKQQATHSLARFTLEVDANYKQFATARQLREAAVARLESARAFYEEGRGGFTVDRLLDSVNQYANAIAQEAQFKASYNTSLCALAEAKGTLLEDRDIVVVDGPRRVPAPMAKSTPVDNAVKPASFDVKETTKPTTIQYQITIDTGSKSIELKGTISARPRVQPSPGGVVVP